MKKALLVSLSVLALAGCPAPLTPEPLEKAPHVTTFSASSSVVNAGETVTLTWATTDATEVRLDEASLGQVSGVDGASGTVDVAVDKSALYVLTARNARGATHRAVIGIRVREAMGDVLLTAMPTLVRVGQPVTLAWSAPEASAVTLTATPGGAVDLGGQTTAGSVTVTPTQSTSYTLVSGTRSATVNVTVQATLLSFTSSTDAIDATDAGAEVTLSWTTAAATRVQLRTPARGTLADVTAAAAVADGGFTDVLPAPIDPSRLYRYELELTGDGPATTGVITLPVRGVPVITSVTAPANARTGQPFALTWTTSGADSLSVYENGTEIHRTPSAATAASGSLTIVAGTSNHTFELVARGARAGEFRENIEVQVVGAPSVTLATNPATVTRGTPYQLTWTGQSVRNVRVLDGAGRLLHEGLDVTDVGAVPLDFVSGDTQRFTLLADNGLGETAHASLTVQPGNAFVITPSVTGAVVEGQRLNLTWPGGETLYGLGHDLVTTRTGSTGFDDIAGTGTEVLFSGTARDDELGAIVTTFRAPFYGRMVGEVITVSTNGYLTFGAAGRTNYIEVPLPTAKLDAMSIAPLWDDLRLASGTVHWQVKPAGSDEVLIVQWTNATQGTTTSSNTFQVKLFSTGQVDVEYQTVTGTYTAAGIMGPRGDEGVALPIAPASGVGATFLAPQTSPVALTARSRQPYGAFIRENGHWVTVSAKLPVVHPEDLQLAEVQMEPSAAVGSTGRWFELYNARGTAIDVAGWSVALPDGGSAALSGVVPADGVRVFGTSVDRDANDDAGVDVALTGFDVNGNAGTFSLGRDGSALAGWSWNNPTTGFAQVSDYGPYRLSTDSTGAPSHPQTCVAPQTYGGQTPRQRGSPGADVSCGFGYRWERVDVGYYDVSRFARKLIANTTTGTSLNVDLSSAPFTFFGVPREGVRVSSEGYLTFDLTAANNVFSSNIPQTAVPNSVIAIFADDQGGRRTESGVFVHRTAQGEDPWAAAPHWIFQWHRWSHVTDDDFNYQVKLFDDGSIEYHFAAMTNGPTTTPYANGSSANTWIENPTGTQALAINASSLTPGIAAFSAYRISPR